jgi:hypothetical protein
MRNPNHVVYGLSGSKEKGTLMVMQTFPRDEMYMREITGKAAELIAASVDAHCLSVPYLDSFEVEHGVFDKEHRLLGKLPRTKDDGNDEEIANQVAKILNKDTVKIYIK